MLQFKSAAKLPVGVTGKIHSSYLDYSNLIASLLPEPPGPNNNIISGRSSIKHVNIIIYEYF